MLDNQIIKESAYQLGIDICRVTDGSELKEARKRLEKRAESKYWPQPFTNQDLDELTKPALHFENLKSIIVVGISYNNQAESPYLSKYVTVKDYHNYLKFKMEKLVDKLKIKLNKDFKYKIFVDTAPFLERAVASRAGAGFIGKNTMLINPDFGSYIFLGEIFTDLEIERDEALYLDCGSCRICLDNCESGALKKEYLLAADDCISYLTQKKGIIPERERKKIGSHVWGCDACQLKCPYNKKIKENNKKEMDFFDKDLKYFLELERNNPAVELKNTAIIWRGSRVLLRNALIVSANLNKNEYFELIKEKLNDNSPIIRYFAAWSLIKLDRKRAKKIIRKHLENENNREFKNKIGKLMEAEEAENGY